MSNVQRRFSNGEVGIRVLSQMILLKDLAFLPQAGYMVHGTSNFVLCTKKRLSFRTAFFFKLNWISSRTHQRSNLRST